LSTRAPIGHLAINTVPMAFNQGCRGLVPSALIDTKYLYYFLFHNVELLNELGSGTTFKELSTGALSHVKLPVPPLPEQRRIVAIVDEAFEGITDDAIVREARENWHPNKLKIPERKFRDMITFIRSHDLIPNGSAKRVVGQGSLF
jgi:restriction endonuclease S subunit